MQSENMLFRNGRFVEHVVRKSNQFQGIGGFHDDINCK